MPSRSPAIVGLLPAPFQEPSCLTTLIQSRTQAIGTITGGLLCSGVSFGCGGLFGTPPATGNFLGVVSVDGTTTIATVTFTNPVSYVGFAWGTPDPENEVDVYNGSTLAHPISTSMPPRERRSLS